MTLREQYLALNSQINSQLKRAGVVNKNCTKIVKPLDTLPDNEWKIWIKELMTIRDDIAMQLDN